MFDATPIDVEIVFDKENPNWRVQAEYNYMFLRMIQNHANDRLNAHGHLFLNDVLDMLDIRRTSQGAIGGWLFGVNGGFIDFGCWSSSTMLSSDNESITLKFSIIPSMYTHI